MGVAGAGKTTVGHLLARELEFQFVEGDAYHSAANVAKMRAGTPLDDPDREPWLAALAGAIAVWIDQRRDVVLACSALRRSYRERLAGGCDEVNFVYLRGARVLIRRRLATRHGHYMPAALLDSQFAALEEPGPDERAIAVEISPSPQDVVATIRDKLTSKTAR